MTITPKKTEHYNIYTIVTSKHTEIEYLKPRDKKSKEQVNIYILNDDGTVFSKIPLLENEDITQYKKLLNIK